jgi:hypothetical protein
VRVTEGAEGDISELWQRVLTENHALRAAL